LSLSGNIEDLPLLDILQVVAFSQKTGHLEVRSQRGESGIVFLEGKVVAAFSWDSLPSDPRAASLPVEKRDALIRNRIEIALEQIIRLREGKFSFSLTTQLPRKVGTRDLAEETLSDGINPVELLLELARGIDEDRRDSAAVVEASFAAPAEESFQDVPLEELAEPALPEPPEETEPAAEPAPPPAPEATGAHAVLLVDDEDDVRSALARLLMNGGYQVVEAADAGSAVRKARGLSEASLPFVLVVDRGMPASDGSSFEGGLEVVRRLQKQDINVPVLLMTDSLDRAVHTRGRRMGISRFLFKPGLSRLDPDQFGADLRAFANVMMAELLPEMARPGEAPTAPAVLTGSAPPPRPRTEEAWRDVATLQTQLEHLRRPQDAMQVTMLVMNVARDVFERGILFLVKDEQLRGLGGFGACDHDEISLVVRDIVIPLEEPSVFRETVLEARTFSGPLPDDEWTRKVMSRIGVFSSKAIALVPLLTHRETIAVLFGDNPDSGAEFPRLDSLEVFINQAGVALENAFLQRKLQALERSAERIVPTKGQGG
jgi:CheY-like chemotaxis protein